MKLVFTHLGYNGRTGAASAIIPGMQPESALDRAASFAIQAGFYILPTACNPSYLSHLTVAIPNTDAFVHINFIWEQEVPGLLPAHPSPWPDQTEYRALFGKMLANMLAHVEAELQV